MSFINKNVPSISVPNLYTYELLEKKVCSVIFKNIKIDQTQDKIDQQRMLLQIMNLSDITFNKSPLLKFLGFIKIFIKPKTCKDGVFL